MTWEMDWADRIAEEYAKAEEYSRAPRTLATSVAELKELVATLTIKAQNAARLRGAIKDAVDHGLDTETRRDDANALVYRGAMARLRQLEELDACGHPTTLEELIEVCVSLPKNAEPSSEGWRATAAPAATRFGHWRVAPRKRERCWYAALETSNRVAELEAVPSSLSGQMSAAGVTQALRALSRFRAASSRDVGHLVRLVDGSPNPWVVGVGMIALASSEKGLRLLVEPSVKSSLAELAPHLWQVVAEGDGWGRWWGLPVANRASYASGPDDAQRAHMRTQVRRAAAVVLTLIEPRAIARHAPHLGSSELARAASLVWATRYLLELDSTRVRRHTFETLCNVQPAALLVPLAPTLLEHAAGRDSPSSREEVTEISALLARMPDADLQTTPQVLSPARALLSPRGPQQTTPGAFGRMKKPSPELQRARQTLGLRVLLRLAGPHLDALLHNAQALQAAQASAAASVDDTDKAKEARLCALLDDVVAVTRGLGPEGDDQLCELAASFVAVVEAPGGASAQRHEKSAALGCGGLVAGAAA